MLAGEAAARMERATRWTHPDAVVLDHCMKEMACLKRERDSARSRL